MFMEGQFETRLQETLNIFKNHNHLITILNRRALQIPELRRVQMDGLQFPNHQVQFSSVAQLCPTLCDPMIAARQASLSITSSRSSLRLTSIESVMPSSHLILCRPLLLLPPIPPSIRVFSNESTLHMAEVLEFQLQHHSFQRNPRADLLQNGLVGSPCSPRDSQESSLTPPFKVYLF